MIHFGASDDDAVPSTPDAVPCDACGAEAGEPCRVGCIGEAAELDRLTPDAVPSGRNPSPTAAHCLVCHAARLTDGRHVIARALTVEASRLYAALSIDDAVPPVSQK